MMVLKNNNWTDCSVRNYQKLNGNKNSYIKTDHNATKVQWISNFLFVWACWSKNKYYTRTKTAWRWWVVYLTCINGVISKIDRKFEVCKWNISDYGPIKYEFHCKKMSRWGPNIFGNCIHKWIFTILLDMKILLQKYQMISWFWNKKWDAQGLNLCALRCLVALISN